MMNGALLSHGYRAVSVAAADRVAYNRAMIDLFADANPVASLLVAPFRREVH